MATIATAKGIGQRRPAKGTAETKHPGGKRVDNTRTETMGRFWIVVMMPVCIAALVALIAFYLTLPLR